MLTCARLTAAATSQSHISSNLHFQIRKPNIIRACLSQLTAHHLKRVRQRQSDTGREKIGDNKTINVTLSLPYDLKVTVTVSCYIKSVTGRIEKHDRDGMIFYAEINRVRL